MSMSTGEKIRDYRNRNGLSLDKFSEKLEMSGGYLGRIETGKKRLTKAKLMKLIEATGLDEIYWNDDYEYLEKRKDLYAINKCYDKLMEKINTESDIERLINVTLFKDTIFKAVAADLKYRLDERNIETNRLNSLSDADLVKETLKVNK